MNRNYKFAEPEGLYFVSFATVHWIDVFVRRLYFDCLVDNLNFCVGENHAISNWEGILDNIKKLLGQYNGKQS